jgi:hypothetical protein
MGRIVDGPDEPPPSGGGPEWPMTIFDDPKPYLFHIELTDIGVEEGEPWALLEVTKQTGEVIPVRIDRNYSLTLTKEE